MPKMSFSQEVKETLDSFLLDNVEVEPGKAFGLPAYYVNGKMFAGVYEDGAILKVPEEFRDELLEREGISEFRPMEKHTMKGWVLLKREDPSELAGDRELFDLAFEYVYSIPREKKKR